MLAPLKAHLACDAAKEDKLGCLETLSGQYLHEVRLTRVRVRVRVRVQGRG